jgi:hypothetical protein
VSNINLAQACIDRTGTATGLDDAIFTTHWVGPSGTSPVDHAGRIAATARLKTFWDAIKGHIHTSHVFREVKWYDVPTTAPYRPVFVESLLPQAAPGDPGGSSGGMLPNQVAFSVTLKTTSRKHWGRFYLPGMTFPSIDTTTHPGTIITADCDAIAAAASGMASQSITQPYVIVWSKALGTSEAVVSVQVDNIPDVIRSRRLKIATYKAHATP